MTIGARLRGVLVLDPATFEDIERDRTAGGQALAIVVAASLAGGIGAGLLFGPLALLRETVAALVGWVLWAGVTYVIGTRVLPEPQTRSDMGELLRVIGFAYAPNLFAVLGVLPLVGGVIRTVVTFWVLAATILAVRQALDYHSTARAIGVVLIGWLFFVVIVWIF
jgi:hypothetical protein